MVGFRMTSKYFSLQPLGNYVFSDQIIGYIPFSSCRRIYYFQDKNNLLKGPLKRKEKRKKEPRKALGRREQTEGNKTTSPCYRIFQFLQHLVSITISSNACSCPMRCMDHDYTILKMRKQKLQMSEITPWPHGKKMGK